MCSPPNTPIYTNAGAGSTFWGLLNYEVLLNDLSKPADVAQALDFTLAVAANEDPATLCEHRILETAINSVTSDVYPRGSWPFDLVKAFLKHLPRTGSASLETQVTCAEVVSPQQRFVPCQKRW